VKFTVNDALWPDAIFRGNDTPLRLNSELVVVGDETVTLDPLALRAIVRLLLIPTTRLPKFKVVGLTANRPAAVPVADRDIVRVEFEASEITEMLPLALPLDFGANTALNV